MDENKDIEISILIDFYGKVLGPQKLEIIDCYYNSDLSLSEIAENIGITRQGVLDSIKRSKTMLYNMEKSLGLARHFKALETKAEKIEKLANNIKKEKLSGDLSNIDKLADEIIKISEGLCD